MSSHDPRIPPLPEAEWTPEAREILTRLSPNDPPLNIFSTLARHPALLKRWLRFGAHILGGSTLSPRERELVILRTGHCCRSAYEVHQHTRIALAAGVSAEDVARTALGSDAWKGNDALLIRAADELCYDKRLSDDTWAALTRHWSTPQILDLIFTVGQYTMVSMALNSLGVQIEARDPEPSP